MGAIGHAKKPTTREELREVFKRLEDKFSQKVKRVLVVAEDDALQRESIARLIGDDDIEITAVGLGVTALELLRTMHFDCMVIDLKLPDMPGDELLKRMSSESHPVLPAGDRLRRAQPDPRGRGGPHALLAVHHHQGRALARAAAR